MKYIDKEGIEWGYRTYQIIAEHYITGERIQLYESIFMGILEQYVKYFEKLYPTYKIHIE